MQNILIIGEQLLEEMEEYLESGELRDGLLTDVENYFKEYTIENVLNYVMDKLSPEVSELHKRWIYLLDEMYAAHLGCIDKYNGSKN